MMVDIRDHFRFLSQNFLVRDCLQLLVVQHQMVSSCLVLMVQSFVLVVAVGIVYFVGLVFVVFLVYHQVVSQMKMLLVHQLVWMVLVV